MPWVFKNEFGESPVISDEELRSLAARGVVTPKTPIRRDTSSSFVNAEQIKGLEFPKEPDPPKDFDFVTEASKPVAPQLPAASSPPPSSPSRPQRELTTTLSEYWANKYLIFFWSLNLIAYIIVNVLFVIAAFMTMAASENGNISGFVVWIGVLFGTTIELILARLIIESVALLFDIAMYLRLIANSTLANERN